MRVDLPHEWNEGLLGFSGVAEYRMHFDAPSGKELLGVYIARACSALQVFVNGELIGSGGPMEQPYLRNCYYPNLFPLPRALLKAQGNELRVQVAGHAFGEAASRQRSSGMSAVQVGSLADLQAQYDSRYTWNITVSQIISTTLLGFGLALFGLWLARRRDRYMLYFALFAIGWAALTARLFTRLSFGSHWATEAFLTFAFFPVVSCALLFLMRLLGRRWGWMDCALALQSAAFALLVVFTPRTQLLTTATALYLVGTVEFLVCIFVFLVLAWRTHRMDFWLVGIVLVHSIVLLGLEMAQQYGMLPLPNVVLGHFTMPLVFSVIAVRLIQLFVRALTQAETLNQELELRVLGKSREIERNWQQIAELRTAQAAQEERRRIASDLHDDLGAQLLTIVQASQRGGQPDRIAAMARQALEEMRLSVRGMTGHVTAAQEALADWRAETVTRLSEAGMLPDWSADDPPADLILPARTHVQVTRILREAVSNAIRHSGGGHCAVRIRFRGGALELEVEDDGRGLQPGGGAHSGHGLLNIERRVRHLGGEHRFRVPPGGAGTLLVVSIPLINHATQELT
ncbi:ATP-binding protein [Variovorax sp. J22R133]|uniref:ATP-binding protein n=1 Tax=Variovorax brevis TaxID=3053503 RepID=UPI0025753A9D|nr:ATP-binding protein [Variovorax sp. J22R133]MDM0117812.1 ATP-binding protein [Variovorax sp. J22R133]